MRMLEELLRQMVQASKNIGNTELEAKFSEAIKLLKRDIVFAASLYLWSLLIIYLSSQHKEEEKTFSSVKGLQERLYII